MRAFQRIKKLFADLERIDIMVNNNVVRQTYQNLFLTNTSRGIEKEVYPEGELIVSLTSYGQKIPMVYLTVESLLNQTIKPNRILLWLDETLYSNTSQIPLSLVRQVERGLEIRLCKDIRSYTKLIPTLKEYPDAVVITVDDDILYPYDFVERLFRAYQNDPSRVYFYRGHYMSFNKDGSPKPYSEWVSRGAKGCDINNVPTGVSGILYPPHCYHEDMFNECLFMQLCPYADDIWFKVMTYLKGTLCEKIEVVNPEKQFIPLDVDKQSSLQNYNVVNGGNDIQIKKVFNYYHLGGENC